MPSAHTLRLQLPPLLSAPLQAAAYNPRPSELPRLQLVVSSLSSGDVTGAARLLATVFIQGGCIPIRWTGQDCIARCKAVRVLHKGRVHTSSA